MRWLCVFAATALVVHATLEDAPTTPAVSSDNPAKDMGAVGAMLMPMLDTNKERAHRYAFQPRRTTLLTPGEQQLAPLAPRTRHPPPRPGSSGAAVRQLPTRSASAAALVAH